MTTTVYAIYLRKSRADESVEGDVLQRHHDTLISLAAKLGLTVAREYREVMSGETISARPQMQELLRDLEQGLYAGVLVMELERLARGDSIDQGIVARAFKYSNTLIITPQRIINPSDEFDEEWLEFGLFMSRREYKTINRRMQAGRIASVKEGNYIGNTPPYGYDLAVIDRKHTLRPNSDEAPIVGMIFGWYTNKEGRIGTTNIAKRLNAMGIPARHGAWTTATIQEMLKNPAYIGMVAWNRRKTVKRMNNGAVVRTRPRNAEHICVQGIHQPIVEREIWDAAQLIISNYRRPPAPRELQNPLAGLVVCSVCGHKMVRRQFRPTQEPYILCNVPDCPTVSARFALVEATVLTELHNAAMSSAVDAIGAQAENTEDKHMAEQQNALQANISRLRVQRERLYTFLEQGVYTADEFIERREKTDKSIAALSAELDDLRRPMATTMYDRIRAVLESYPTATTQARNDMLKSVIKTIVYSRDKTNQRNRRVLDDFSIAVHYRTDI